MQNVLSFIFFFLLLLAMDKFHRRWCLATSCFPPREDKASRPTCPASPLSLTHLSLTRSPSLCVSPRVPETLARRRRESPASRHATDRFDAATSSASASSSSPTKESSRDGLVPANRRCFPELRPPRLRTSSSPPSNPSSLRHLRRA